MSPLDRRTLLKGAGAAVAATAVGRSRATAQPLDGPFRWGVASFDPTTNGVILWTRVEPSADGRPVTLGWSLSADAELGEVVASGTTDVGPDTDWCAIVDVTELPSGGVWWYAFAAADDAVSAVGRTRTMPETGERLRVGLVSCGRFASARFGVYRALSEREVDLVVHVGDYIYEDGGGDVRQHEPPRELITVDDYRTRYAQHRRDADLQALHGRHPMVAVWDDHEVAGNAWRDGAAGHDETQDGPWIDRLLAAGRARSEWVPGRTDVGADGRLRAWRSLPLGSLAELVVLDTRTWGRDRQPASAADMGSPAGAHRSMLGDDQHAFVSERLGAEDRPPWVLLANQVMYHPTVLPAPPGAIADAMRDGGLLVSDGLAINPDQWDGYPEAREALNVAMGGKGGVVVLSGDIHSSWAWEGPANDGGEPAMVEVVTPSVSTLAGAARFGLEGAVIEAGLMATQPGLSFVDLGSHGYVIADLTADELHAEWWFVDPADATTEKLGAALRSPRQTPMRFEAVDGARPDPEPTTTSTKQPASSTTVAPQAPSVDGDDSIPLFVGVGATLAAVAAGAVALRRRRT